VQYLRWPRSIAVILALALAIALPLAYVTQTDAPAAVSPLSQEIDQTAVNFATANGNSTPQSVTWVASTFNGAENLMNGGPNADTPVSGAFPVYVLVITGGDFTMSGASELKAGPAPEGTVLFEVIKQSNWSWSGSGVGDSDSYGLSTLGTPETDSLAGITPDSAAQFARRFTGRRTMGLPGN
jgi:hypothetical protein